MNCKEIVRSNDGLYETMREELLNACRTGSREPADSEKRKRAKKEVSQMSLSDNALFVTLMKSTVLFNHVLSTIMGREMTIVGEITEVSTEHSIELGLYRNVRLDALAKDSNGKLYNIEMENSVSRATPKRARYYASASDVSSLRTGDDFELLSDHYHFFLTDGDVIGNGETVNVFSRKNQDGRELGDGSCIFFVNMRCNGEDMLGKLLRSMRESELDKIEDSIVKNALSLVKEETEMQISIYDTKVMLSEEREKAIAEKSFKEGMKEGLEEGKKEGIKEGELIEKKNTVARILENGNKDVEFIMSVTGLGKDDVIAIIKDIEK